MNKKRRGAWGEQKAVEFLEKKGYIILMRNFRSAEGEIDIIAQTGERIVFVEVKVLSTFSRMELGRSVGEKKQQRIRNAASIFIGERSELSDTPLRCDVIGVFPHDGELMHIENAF